MVIFAALLRRGGRAAECTGLENRRWATIRGFKSHLLRHSYRAHATMLHGLFICLRLATPPSTQQITLLNLHSCRLNNYQKIPHQPRTSAFLRASLPISLLPQTTTTQRSDHGSSMLVPPITPLRNNRKAGTMGLRLKKREQLTQEVEIPSKRSRRISDHRIHGLWRHQSHRTKRQRFSEERVPSGTSGYLWNQKTAKSNNKNRGEEIRWVNYQTNY